MSESEFLSLLYYYFFLMLHRPAQTCHLLRKDHHQQELPCHPQQREAHHSQEQLQEGPAHGGLDRF